jgi:hypothetical protein
MIAFLLVLMQFMISAKAGLVNYVDGQATVTLHEQVPPGVPIQTGLQSYVEILLNPGSFLRLDENSTVVLDSVELTNIAVRVVSGTAIIETANIDKDSPIKVASGSLPVLIVSPGVYRFSDDTASVLDGKLRTLDSSVTVKKGQQVTQIGNHYEKSKIAASAVSDGLDGWSEQRSAELARANAMAYRDRSINGFYQSGAYFPVWGFGPNSAAWIYSPSLSGFTFFPPRTYRSFYGYSFVPIFGFGRTIFTRPSGRVAGPRPSGNIGGRSGQVQSGAHAHGGRGGFRGR